MHEQEFERSVQKELEGLSFAPSPAVWEGVAAAIQPNKDRKYRLLWVPIFLLLAGIGTYWMLSSTPGKNEVAATKKSVNSAPRFKETNVDNTSLVNSSKLSNATAGFSNEENPNKRPDNISVNTVHTKNIKGGHTGFAPVVKQTVFAHKQSSRNAVTINSFEEVIADAADAPTTKSFRLRNFPAVAFLTQKTGTLLQQLQQGIHFNTSDFKTKSGRKSGIAYGFEWDFGLLNIESNQSASPLHANAAVNNFALNVLPPRPAPALTSGQYLHVGFTLKKQLARRLHAATGAGYTLLTQRMEVGQRFESMVARTAIADQLSSTNLYAGTGNNSTYYSKHHFVSIPFYIVYQPLRKLPLEMQSGINTGYLIGGKSLEYDAASNLYFETKSQQQKWALLWQSSIQYRLLRSKRWKLSAGPAFGLPINKMQGLPGQWQQYSIRMQLQQAQ